MDNNLKQEILQLLDTVKFGKIVIELNEKSDHVDVYIERTKRFFKKIKTYNKE